MVHFERKPIREGGENEQEPLFAGRASSTRLALRLLVTFIFEVGNFVKTV